MSDKTIRIGKLCVSYYKDLMPRTIGGMVPRKVWTGCGCRIYVWGPVLVEWISNKCAYG